MEKASAASPVRRDSTSRKSKRRRLDEQARQESKTNSGPSRTIIHKLPDAVLGTILEYAVTLRERESTLNTLPSVCQRWRNVCKELVKLPRLYLNFKLDSKLVCADGVNARLRALHDRFKGINELQIVGYEVPSKYWSPRGATLTSGGLKNLLMNGKVREADSGISDSISQFLRPEMGLKSLSLVTSHRSHAEELVGRCAGLTTLELGCGVVATMGKLHERMMLEARAAEREEAGSDWDSDAYDGFDDYEEDEDSGWTRTNTAELINDDTLSKILTGCTKLTRLKLGNFQQHNVCSDFITGAGIRGCPNLVELDISDCASITDQGMASICRSCPKIRHLTMGSDLPLSEHVITDEGFRRIANLPYLEVLEIGTIGTKLTARAFEGVLTSCPKLSELRFSDDRSEPVAEAFKLLAVAGRTSPSLKKVKLLQGASISVIDIARVCTSLEELECDACEGADTALQALAQGCPVLESLRIGFWGQDYRRINDADIRGLAGGCPHLKTFHINGDSYRVGCDVSDDGLKALLKSCQGLNSIRLPGPSKVTDFGLFHISRRARRMKCLDLRRSPGVTIAGILAVLNGCPLLEKFEVDVPEEWVGVLKGDFPQLGDEWPQSWLPYHSLHRP